ncbi:MAG: hypothetical protein KF878_22625, partial [Planctomycetes bacterium]|nr:hypothetical protein [Planctomycetota bacterium]
MSDAAPAPNESTGDPTGGRTVDEPLDLAAVEVDRRGARIAQDDADAPGRAGPAEPALASVTGGD